MANNDLPTPEGQPPIVPPPGPPNPITSGNPAQVQPAPEPEVFAFTYRVRSADGFVVRNDNAVIPPNAAHPHYQQFLRWIAAGNVAVAINPDPPLTVDQIYANVLQDQAVFKAFVLALNDGTFVPGSNLTPNQIRTIIKAHM